MQDRTDEFLSTASTFRKLEPAQVAVTISEPTGNTKSAIRAQSQFTLAALHVSKGLGSITDKLHDLTRRKILFMNEASDVLVQLRRNARFSLITHHRSTS